MIDETSELIKLRKDKLAQLRELGADPFGQAFPDVEDSQSILNSFEEGKVVRFAGRVVSHRNMGKSHFLHLQDQEGRLQVYLRKNEFSAEEFSIFELLDLGDFLGVEGKLFNTKVGEKTIHVQTFRYLGKSILPLPDKWKGLSDVEARYRQRYLDLVSNADVKETLKKRSLIVREIRHFMEDRGFLEVETPMMQAVAGGAAAQPFKTHHKALGLDLYLRIAPELYLKRLLVGGFDRVFELNRNFRNEGISRKHNPEFTMLEAYWAYADFEQMAQLVEQMICHLAQKICGTLHIPVAGKEEDTETPHPTINLTAPWPRKRYHHCICDAAGQDWFELDTTAKRNRAEYLGVHVSPAMEDFEITQEIFEKLVEAKTLDPLFVTHLPKELVPLAKQNAENPDLVDVYELIINGQEISPGYTELNDPIVQRQRLEEQAGEEVQKVDEDFLAALEHGMPPAGGIGLGIDRLAMLLTSSESIRDVILFPLLKPKNHS